jgi:hypothetical protein
MLFIIQAYVIIAQSRDIFGSGMVHHFVFRKLIYTPEWFLSIILQKKLHAVLGGFSRQSFNDHKFTMDIRFLPEPRVSEPRVDENVRK